VVGAALIPTTGPDYSIAPPLRLEPAPVTRLCRAADQRGGEGSVIVVCGRRFGPGARLQPIFSRWRPEAADAALPIGLDLGPDVRIGFATVTGDLGTGAGLTFRIRF
jgi:hypothetical protein